MELVTKVAIPANPNTPQGKSQLTSILQNKFIGTRRIHMTKGNILGFHKHFGSNYFLQISHSNKFINLQQLDRRAYYQRLRSKAKRRINRSSWRPLARRARRSQQCRRKVRGLMPGQQLVQMPDGKLHVLNTTPTVTAALTSQQAASAAGTSASGASTPATARRRRRRQRWVMVRR